MARLWFNLAEHAEDQEARFVATNVSPAQGAKVRRLTEKNVRAPAVRGFMGALVHIIIDNRFSLGVDG